jgi:hypothetical protein
MLPQFRQTRHAACHALRNIIYTRIKTTDVLKPPERETALQRTC